MDAVTSELLAQLKEAHDKIMAYENSALKALDEGDTEEYRNKITEKAALLSSLHSRVTPLLSQLQGSFWETVKKTLSEFSNNAHTALGLDSIFFMSALLYPDDYKKGTPDNLQKLIDKISIHINPS